MMVGDLNAYHFYKANYIIGEVNNGGDLVEGVIRQIDPRVVYRGVRASRRKFVRAEPVAQLYEQGRMHHVKRPEAPREFETLEDQMCQFVPGNLGASSGCLPRTPPQVISAFFVPEIDPEPTASASPKLVRKERLGGLLNYYIRSA